MTMSPENINLAMSIAGGVATVGASFWAFMKWLWPSVVRLYHRFWVYVDQKQAIQAGLAQLPTALAKLSQMDNIQTQLTLITRQVLPNGGSSLPDSLARLETQFSVMQAKSGARDIQIAAIGQQVAMVGMTMKATLETNPSMATFEASDMGLLTEANNTLLRWTGQQISGVRNWGWVNAVHPDDRTRVRGEWNQAVADCRQLKVRFKMLDDSGIAFYVELTMTPLPEGVAHCDKFVGVIYRVEP